MGARGRWVAATVVAAALTGVGCGDQKHEPSARARADAIVRDCRTGAIPRSWRTVTYRAGPGYPGGDARRVDAAIDAAADTLCRDRSLGRPGAVRVRPGRFHLVEVSVPGDAPEPPANLGVQRVFFYDWEANVLGAHGRPRPDDVRVSGGAAAGQGAGACRDTYAAVRLAGRPGSAGSRDYGFSPRSYLVDDRSTTVLAGPAVGAGALATPADLVRAGRRVVHVRPGTMLVGAERGARRDCAYVLRDVPLLGGADLTDVRAGRDRNAGEPAVTFRVRRPAAVRWQRATAAIARRGGGDPMDAQHFAIVADGRLLSVPAIDPRQTPNGLGAGAVAQIVGQLTPAGARRLASDLRQGAAGIHLDRLTPPPHVPPGR